MILSFTCNNCQAILSKNKIMKHYCINNAVNTNTNSNDANSNNYSVIKISENNFPIILINNQQWNGFVINLFTNYETNDEKLKLVLDWLKKRKNFPRKKNKFHNYVNASVLSKNVPNCANIVWEIISNGLEAHSMNKSAETKPEILSPLANQKRKLNDDYTSSSQINSDISEQKKPKISETDVLFTASNAENHKLNSTTEIEKPLLNSATEIEAPLLDSSIVIEKPLLNSTTEMEKPLLDSTIAIEKPLLNSATETEAPLLDSAIVTEKPSLNTATEMKKPLLDSAIVIENSSINSTSAAEILKPANESVVNRNIIWKNLIAERLSKYETNDENLKKVIKSIINRKFLPQKEKKFKNLLNSIPVSFKIQNCFEIIWNIIQSAKHEEILNTPKFPEVSVADIKLDGEFLNLLKIRSDVKFLNSKIVNSSSEEKIIEKQSISINGNMIGKPVKKFKQGYSNKDWHEQIQEAFNGYQSTDSKLLEIIRRLKTRTNIPQRFDKFQNYIRHLSKSDSAENYANILWDIILPGNPNTSSSALLIAKTSLES